MISKGEYIQFRAFARYNGLIMGLVWSIAFACFAGSMVSPSWQFGFVLGISATPFVMISQLRHYRNKIVEKPISYRRSVAFCFMTMLHAALILAAATVAYFYFIDNGLLISTLRQNIEMPEVRESLISMGIKAKEIDQQIDMIAQLRPVDFACSIFINTIITSSILSFLTGIAGITGQINTTKR